jgi:DNA recombination protein RmuC
VSAYNQTVGSLESRVLVSARRLNDLGVVGGEISPLVPVEETARALSAPELVASGAAELESAEGWQAGFDPADIDLVRAAR